MPSCKVMKCNATATTSFKMGPPEGSLGVPVCADHLTAIDNGEQWMLGGSVGVDDPNGGPGAGTGFTILMGDNLPPRYRGMRFHYTEGSEPGYVMQFDADGPQGPKSFDFWMPKEEFDFLAASFAPTSSE